MNKTVNSLLSKYGDDDDSAIDKCDDECLVCPCNTCKNIARSLKGKNQSLSEDLSYFKNLYYQAQINYENEQKYADELLRKLEECCPDNPCDGVDCGKHGKCVDGSCVCNEYWNGDNCQNYIYHCPKNVCYDDKTGRNIEQCSSNAPFACYDTSKQQPFQWGCYSDVSGEDNCNTNFCDTRSCNPNFYNSN